MNFLQWPAMLITVTAAWGAGSEKKGRRRLGFWLFLLSNVLWALWGFSVGAWALIILQFLLAIMNIRGARNNEPKTSG